MYEFLTGPGLWISLFVCLGGLAIRVAYLFGVSRARDRVLYNHVKLTWAARSIVHWSVPWASAAMRKQPVFTLMGFAFHLSLIAVPLFFAAHNILWDEAHEVSLPSMPNEAADLLTGIMVLSGLFLLLRKIVRPEVRALASGWDYALLLLTMAPFVTGFLAFHQLGPYDALMLAHVATGELLLILIPFTKLTHGVLFIFTRAFIGFEMGARRGARSW